MADQLTLDRQAMKNRATAHLRIYVGNLTEQATVEALFDHFISFGKIDGIVVNRNFGFVQFEHEESAQDAIAKADGSVFQGKSICVRTAMSNDQKQQHQPQREVVTIKSDLPPAVALSDNIPVELPPPPEENDDLYDSYGNFIGDQTQGVPSQEATYTDPIVPAAYPEEEEPYPAPRNDTRPPMRGQRGGRAGRGPRGGRGARGGMMRDRSPAGGRGDDWSDSRYDRYSQSDYPRPVPVTERNDCEIIVVSKALTEYAEYIETRLKRLGIVVDLLFPMEDVPIGKVLGNIASRGCLYAILVMPQNQEHKSLTLTILHGLPQEHRNMPLEDALQLLSRNFQEVQRGGSSGREAVYALLGQLADGRTLTVLQYDKVIEYLQERREQQVKIEVGEPLATSKEVDLQQRILSILNDKKILPTSEPAAPAAPAQNKLLNDPTVRQALDSILQKLV